MNTSYFHNSDVHVHRTEQQNTAAAYSEDVPY